jgi:membrane-bound serine protease (ClpP class)
MLGEKFQSPIRAKFRTLAKRNGYPERLTEAMVSQDMIVYEVNLGDSTMYLDSTEFATLSAAQKKSVVSSRIIVERGELLTMDDVEAQRLRFSQKSVADFKDLLKTLGLEDAEVIRLDENWSETFVRFIASIAPILIMIGFAALYIEIRTPGFGAPGIIGITCLSLVFLSQYMVGLADYTELLLMAIGAVLLAIEIFVLPGFGIAGITGILFIVAGTVLSFQDFVIPNPTLPWQAEKLMNNLIMVIGSIIGSVVFIVLFFRFIFPRIGTVVKGPYLQATLQGAASFDMSKNLPHIGDSGTASTPLRPSGKVFINGDTFDVTTEGDFIDRNTPVVISSISGNHITVQRKTEQ